MKVIAFNLYWHVPGAGFRKSHPQPERTSPFGCKQQLLVAGSYCRLPHPTCDKAIRLAFHPSPCIPFIPLIPNKIIQ